MKWGEWFLRYGWGAVAGMAVVGILVVVIGDGEHRSPLPAKQGAATGTRSEPIPAPLPDSIERPPVISSALPRDLPVTAAEQPSTAVPVTPTIPPIIPAGGTEPIAPATPVAPAPPVMPVVPPYGAMAAGGPLTPQTPTVAVPTMTSLPGVSMPVSPAAFPPAPTGPATPALVIQAPVAPASAPTLLTESYGLGSATQVSSTIVESPRAKVQPSQAPIIPQPFATGSTQPPAPPANPQVLPTPTDLPPPAPGTMPNLSNLVNPSMIPSGPGADGTPLNDRWRYGLRFESAEKDFSLFIGGRVQFDTVDYLTTTGMRQNIPGNVPLEDGVTFRRVRLDLGGTIYRNMQYYAQLDFFNGFVTSISENRLSNVPVPTDLWMQFTDLPVVGTLRVGNQKPLYSFEHLTSSRFLNFLERSLGFDAFVEGFNNGFEPGITLQNTFLDQRGTAGIGLFKTTRSPFGWNVGRDETELSGRITFLPVYAEGGKYLIHIGVGGANRDPDDNQVRFRSRLDARNSPSAFSPLIADTGFFFGNRQQIIVPELVMVAGPWSFQSEYYGSWVQNASLPLASGGFNNMGTVYLQSAYGEVHCFLTGEHRDYDRNTGTFTRVVPKRPLAWTRCGFTGCGAWQVAARYSYLDLIDKGINGGRIHDMTLGLNWFLNPNMKVQWNYFLAHRNVADPAGDGFIQGFATRLAVDF